MQHEIHGHLAQYARVTFEAGETCWAGKGAIMSYGNGVSWTLKVPGGVAGAAQRMLSGEGLALAHLRAEHGGATASLASSQPGRIFTWDLAVGPVVTTRGS